MGRFSDHGSVTLRVSSKEYDAESKEQEVRIFDSGPYSRLCFEIIDTGVGIAPQDLPLIFAPFQQVGDKNKQTNGTGLGLVISHSLVSLMDGHLQAESPPTLPSLLEGEGGQGSRFWFEINLAKVSTFNQDEATFTKERLIIGFNWPQSKTKTTSPKVLVVDDKWENRAIFVDLLTPLGFAVSEAVNGREGLDKAKQLQPDVIIIDLIMPEMDGFELIEQISQWGGTNGKTVADLPVIIATSASVYEEDKQHSLTVGAHAFIPKPVRVNQLFEVLQKYLGLEWVYAPTVPKTNRVDKSGEENIIPPPPNILTTLIELADNGDIEAIREQAAELALHEQYKPFAVQLEKLAKTFQINKIRTMLEAQQD